MKKKLEQQTSPREKTLEDITSALGNAEMRREVQKMDAADRRHKENLGVAASKAKSMHKDGQVLRAQKSERDSRTDAKKTGLAARLTGAFKRRQQGRDAKADKKKKNMEATVARKQSIEVAQQASVVAQRQDLESRFAAAEARVEAQRLQVVSKAAVMSASKVEKVRLASEAESALRLSTLEDRIAQATSRHAAHLAATQKRRAALLAAAENPVDYPTPLPTPPSNANMKKPSPSPPAGPPPQKVEASSAYLKEQTHWCMPVESHLSPSNVAQQARRSSKTQDGDSGDEDDEAGDAQCSLM